MELIVLEIIQIYSVTSGNNYTMSIFAKAGERTGLRFANAAESNAEGSLIYLTEQ